MHIVPWSGLSDTSLLKVHKITIKSWRTSLAHNGLKHRDKARRADVSWKFLFVCTIPAQILKIIIL